MLLWTIVSTCTYLRRNTSGDRERKSFQGNSSKKFALRTELFLKERKVFRQCHVLQSTSKGRLRSVLVIMKIAQPLMGVFPE